MRRMMARSVLSNPSLWKITLSALTWTVIDYDGNNNPDNIQDDNGFWSISHNIESYKNADVCIGFRLMPLLPQYRKPIEAEWSFKCPRYESASRCFSGRILRRYNIMVLGFRRRYNFNGTTSGTRVPKNWGIMIITLKVTGPKGTAKRIKVWDVVVK